MKKITSIALILVLALLLPCFASCNGEDTPPVTDNNTTTAPDTTAADAQVTNVDGSCRHVKMNDWEASGKYTCTGLAIKTRTCKHCDFTQYDYVEDSSGNFGDHVCTGEALATYPGASNLSGFEIKTCSFCQENIKVDTEATNTRKNLLVVTPEMYESAGFSNVTEYLKSEHGTHIHKLKGSSDWGHIGYGGAHGTATIYDSFRDAVITTDGTVFYWNLKDVENRYTPHGVLVEDGSDETAKYCALIGIDFYATTNISGFGIFLENQNEIAFDVLGGTKNADGTTSWRILTSFNGEGYQPYNETTSFALGDFEAADVDCIQIGVTNSYANILSISEIEIYG